MHVISVSPDQDTQKFGTVYSENVLTKVKTPIMDLTGKDNLKDVSYNSETGKIELKTVESDAENKQTIKEFGYRNIFSDISNNDKRYIIGLMPNGYIKIVLINNKTGEEKQFKIKSESEYITLNKIINNKLYFSF